MNDYKQLFGYAAIIMAVGFLVRSFMPAYAFNGPTVSMGSNPNEHYSGTGSSTIYTNNTTETFIVTDIIYYSYGSVTELSISGQKFGTFSSTGMYSLRTGLKVPPGESLTSSSYYNQNYTTISGYYVH